MSEARWRNDATINWWELRSGIEFEIINLDPVFRCEFTNEPFFVDLLYLGHHLFYESKLKWIIKTILHLTNHVVLIFILILSLFNNLWCIFHSNIKWLPLNLLWTKNEPSFSEQQIVLILNNSWLICSSSLADYQVVSSLAMADHFSRRLSNLLFCCKSMADHGLNHSPSVIDCCIIVSHHHSFIQTSTRHRSSSISFFCDSSPLGGGWLLH